MKIWEACRATSAALTFFEPIEIGENRYSDGGLLYNNPVVQVEAEGHEIFPGDDIFILSLGTGITPSMDFRPNLVTVGPLLAGVATATTRVANDFARTARENRYFRFDVPSIGDIELDEFKQLTRIENLTYKYLNDPEAGKKGSACAARLGEGELTLPELPIPALSSAVEETDELQERLERLRSP